MRALHADDEGQILPILVLVFGVLVASILWFAQAGLAGGLRAGAQSAADAAALAAASELRTQAQDVLRNGPRPDQAVADVPRSDNAARSYADRNGATVRRIERQGLRVRVEVETEDRLRGRAADSIGVSGTRGEASARARFRAEWASGRPEINRPSLSTNRIRNHLLRYFSDPLALLDETALRANVGCPQGSGIRNLVDDMHDAIAHLEWRLVAPLQITDGYRRPGCGADSGVLLGLYGPENYGHAIRVASVQVGQVAALSHTVGLCQPYPSTDPGLFALRGSDICDGQTGPLGPDQVYGGDLDRFVTFEVELIRDE